MKGEKGICEANLRYLSQLHNPSLNKLLSTLASDVPLDARRIKQSLFPIPSFEILAPPFTTTTTTSSSYQQHQHQHHYQQHQQHQECSDVVTQKRYHRDMKCHIDPEIYSPHHSITSSPTGENPMITNLSTSSLFSPSVFRSPSNTAQYFTFDNYHDAQQSTPSRPINGFKQSDQSSSQTPRLEKGFYSPLCDQKFLESPKYPELRHAQHGNGFFGIPENQNEISPDLASQHTPKKTLIHEAEEGDIDPDDFLALENWLHLQTTSREGEFGIEPIHSTDFPTSEPSNFDHGSVPFNLECSRYGQSNEVGVTFTLPSLPALPRIAPPLSIADLDHVLTIPRPISPPVSIPVPYGDAESKDIPELPPLPSIPLSAPIPIPFSLPENEVIPPIQSTKEDHLSESAESEDEQIDADDCSSFGNRMNGTYGLCRQLIKYFNDIKNPEKDFKDLDPNDLARILNVRSRRMKDLFQILETLRVVC